MKINYGAYGPFRVVMDRTTGYINATKMCRSGGKDFCDWTRLKGSQELIQTLLKDMVLENAQPSLQNFDLALEDYHSADMRNGNLAIHKAQIDLNNLYFF